MTTQASTVYRIQLEVSLDFTTDILLDYTENEWAELSPSDRHRFLREVAEDRLCLSNEELDSLIKITQL
jgi:hypothetical protein